ncbi:MAG: sulfurtransferase [Flavobacteriaceae bacterium]|nr:sulfurtransferase [Flavobacteriaceae bacterium]
MNNIRINSPLVSIEWLSKNMDAKNAVVLDATIPKITSDNNNFDGLSSNQIKNTRFIDIKNKFSDLSTELPNTMLTSVAFEAAARDLGINNDSAIVVYDLYGIYSSSRVWWMFKAMGHDNIAVLDGGFPEWEKAGFETEKKRFYSVKKGDFKADYNERYFNDFHDVLKAIENRDAIVLDARAENRFKGLVEEPRKGLRSGHIPTSLSFPYSKLITGNKMISKEKISEVFTQIVNTDKPLMFSCGSGVTACTLALGAEIIGLKNISVYDGSWTEWGSNLKLPIEK